MIHLHRAVRYCLVAALMCALPTHAQPGRMAPLLSEYTHTAWSPLTGAPAGIVSIVQTKDGWLWLATEMGLYRSDGVNFERVDTVYGHPLSSNNVLNLMAARDGSLWVGYRYGGISRFSQHGAEHFTTLQGLPDGTIRDIAQAPDGATWAATSEGAVRLAPGAGRVEKIGDAVGLSGKAVFKILFSSDATQWIASEDGLYFRRPGAQRYTRAGPRQMVQDLKDGANGVIWAQTKDEKYFRVRSDAPAAREPRYDLSAHSLGLDTAGNIWLLKRNGIERRRSALEPGGPLQQLTETAGLSGLYADAFLQDREGNVWLGTPGGLDRFRRNRIQHLPVTGMAHPAMALVPDGKVLIGDFIGGLRSVDRFGMQQPLSKERFSASNRNADGVLWFGGDAGLHRWTPDGGRRSIARPPGLEGRDIQALQQDRAGALWVAISGGGGVFKLTDERLLKDGGLAGLPKDVPLTMAMDHEGTVWMGYAGDVIGLIGKQDGRPALRHLDAGAGLRLNSVLALQADGKLMWAGGERGVMLYRDGRFTPLKGLRGEAFRGVTGIARLPDGELWLNGLDGIYRIDAASVARWLKEPAHLVSFRRYDAHDGVRGHPPQLRPLSSLLRTPDGLLWFSTNDALMVIDPAHLYRNQLPPPVQILHVGADEQSYAPRSGRPLRLPQGTENLRIGYTALSLSMPERLRFRYRLAGVDRDWQDAAERRAASYNHLSPGNYRFEVTALNEDGIPSKEAAVVDIDIPPTFFQTRWFTLTLVLAGAALLLCAYTLRVRQLGRRMLERHQAQLEERYRIARSLHDTLLQSIQGVLLSFSAHARRVQEGSTERARLDGTLRQGWALIAEGRDQINGLRAPGGPNQLSLAMERLCQDLTASGEQRFDLRTTGVARALKPGVHDELYVIGREALFNAAQHARATRCSVALEYGGKAFTLRVSDDGCGIDAAVMQSGARPGHWGLAGMRERAENLGARFTIVSGRDEGTVVTVTLGADLAYPDSARPRRWRFGESTMR